MPLIFQQERYIYIYIYIYIERERERERESKKGTKIYKVVTRECGGIKEIMGLQGVMICLIL